MAGQRLIFKDRTEAGQQLAAALPALDPDETVVVALPRGGVTVAAEICAAHGLPMDLLLVRKIGAPGQPELALGAVTDGAKPRFAINENIARQFHLTRDEVEDMGRNLLPEIERRRQTYLTGRAALPLEGKTLVVVDDGVATGATLRACLAVVDAAGPKRVVVALPVGPMDLAARLGPLADTVICLSDLMYFGGVGGAYRSFPQVSDETVRAALERFAPRKTA